MFNLLVEDPDDDVSLLIKLLDLFMTPISERLLFDLVLKILNRLLGTPKSTLFVFVVEPFIDDVW